MMSVTLEIWFEWNNDIPTSSSSLQPKGLPVVVLSTKNMLENKLDKLLKYTVARTWQNYKPYNYFTIKIKWSNIIKFTFVDDVQCSIFTIP